MIQIDESWFCYYKIIGALTNKAYAFKHRPWELIFVNSIDILDSFGSSIRYYLYGSEIKRILPLKNDYINEDWISNRTRYFFEGLYKWRLNIPLMKKIKTLIYTSWLQSFYFFFFKIWFYSFFYKTQFMSFILNFYIDYDLLITTKLLSNLMGMYIFNNNKINYINDYYLFYINPFFFDIIKKEGVYIFIGLNIRLESPILNIKLRKNFYKENIYYYNIGSIFNDNLNMINIGLNIKNLWKIFNGKLNLSINILKNIKEFFYRKNDLSNLLNIKQYLNIFIGNNIILQKDNKNIFDFIKKENWVKNFIFNIKTNKIINNKNYILFNVIKIRKFCNKVLKKQNINLNFNIININLFNMLYNELNVININNIQNLQNIDIIYILNGNFFFKQKDYKFIIYQGHSMDLNLDNIDLIFPNTNFLEKTSNFLNIDGNILRSMKIITRPNFCRNDWMILNALYIFIVNLYNKIYKFFKKKKLNFLNSNRFCISLQNINDIFSFLKKYSINFYYKEITKYNKNKLLITPLNSKNRNIFMIFNRIINNFYYNIYTLNIIDKNSSTLKFAAWNFSQQVMRNYINILY